MREPVLPPGIPGPLDRELLAWAAGFFDGEGTTLAKHEKSRGQYWQLQVVVPQSGRDGVPAVLKRFKSAALGAGRIDPPNEDDVYRWRARGRIDAEATLALMWPYLSEVKRAQAGTALEIVNAQYASGGIHRRAARFIPEFVAHAAVTSEPEPVRRDRAWAAGLLDAEGWFGAVKGRRRKDGSPSYRIRVSASQHSEDGEVPEVLRRLQRTLGVGVIERHGEPDDFKWVAYGHAAFDRVLEATTEWLGDVKRCQARDALVKFQSQRRTRSDSATTCFRGHTYDRVVIGPDGTVRKYCNACARMTERARRATRGAKSRKVKNRPSDETRVYRIA